MSSTVVTAFIGLIGSLLVAVATYLFTKRREREAEWRMEKLAYKSFVESLSGIVDGDSSPDDQRIVAKATNNLLLFAPQPVLEALTAFRDEIRVSNPNRTQEEHDRLLATLLLAVRRDVGVFPRDNVATFSPKLWASRPGKPNYAVEQSGGSRQKHDCR